MAGGNITSEVTKEKDWTVFAICGAEGFVKDVIEESNMNAIVTIYGERSELL